MGAEAVRLNALLFQARCGADFEPACWQALLATRRDAARAAQPDAPDRAELAALPAGVPGLLRGVALAAGLADAPPWQLQALAPARLQLALQDVAHCRFVLALAGTPRELRIESLEDRCCSRAPCA
jgi:hypothetical protein